MIMLTAGVLLWIAVHLFPAAAPAARHSLADKMGANPYRGVFTLLILASLLLIVFGWRSTIPETVYLPPEWGRHLAMLLVLIGFILFSASHGRNNIQRVIRHPQLSGVFVWGIAHLLANGESRSIVLFGGFTLWALVSIVLINRRDGARDKQPAVPFKKDVIAVVGGVVVYAVVLFSHRWIAGIPLINPAG
jgi:uncharacterized membrane protein